MKTKNQKAKLNPEMKKQLVAYAKVIDAIARLSDAQKARVLKAAQALLS